MKWNTNLFHPAWVTGFIDGEGTFYVGINANKEATLGYWVTLEFSITQHVRDLELMRRLPEFLGCGYVTVLPNKNICQYRLRNVAELEQYLFPLLDEYPLQTMKALDAKTFREVHALIKAKQHLTVQGLDQIRVLKATMNRGRSSNLV